MSEHSPWWSEKGFIAAAGFLALLAVAGIALALDGGNGNSRASSASTPARHAAPIDTGGSVCGLPRGSQDPVVGPPDADWSLVGSVAAPSVPDVGPGVVDGHDRRCYAHSPLGAAIAAANIVALSGLPDDSLTDAQALGHLVPSHVVDVYAKQPSPAIDPSTRLQIAGLRTDLIDENNVTVTLAIRTNRGALASWAMPMRWMAPGDWRVRLLSLQEPFAIEQLYTLDGFIGWSGA